MSLARRTSSLLTVNDTIVNETIRHSTQLERLRAGEAKRVARLLDDSLSDLMSKLRSRLRRIKTRGFDTGVQSTKALRDLGGIIDTQLRTALRAVSQTTAANMNKLAISESQWAKATTERAFPISVQLNAPSPVLLRTLVSENPFHGRVLKQWYTDLSVSSRKAARAALTTGLVQGETISQLSKRMQTALNVTKRHATAITRTAVNHVTTRAREATFAENSDVIKAVRYIATLDARTTDICASLDGREFPIGEGPRPPQHFLCRSDIVAVTKSWKELGIKGLGEVKAGTRASNSIPPSEHKRITRLPKAEKAKLKAQMSGQVPATQTYNSWLRNQPVALQNEALGVRRAQLFRNGTITNVRDLVDQSGRSLTLDELEGFNQAQVQYAKPSQFASVEVPARKVDKILDQLTDTASKTARSKLQSQLAELGVKYRTGMFHPKQPDPRLYPRVPGNATPKHKRLLQELSNTTSISRRAKITKELRDTGFTGDTRGWRPGKGPTPTKKVSTPKVSATEKKAAETLRKFTEPTSELNGEQLRERILAERSGIDDEIKKLKRERNAEFKRLIAEANEHKGTRKYYDLRDKAFKYQTRTSDKVEQLADKFNQRLHEYFRVKDPMSPLSIKKFERATAKSLSNGKKATEFVRSVTSKRAYSSKEEILLQSKPGQRGLHMDGNKATLRDPETLQRLNLPKRRAGYNRSVIRVDSNDPVGTVVHEIGHGLELHSDIHKQTAAFLKRRTQGEKLTRLFSNEYGRKDKFIDPYMGKHYGDAATEIFSSGLEMLYKNPMKLIREDPEYFEFMINVLRGRKVAGTVKKAAKTAARKAIKKAVKGAKPKFEQPLRREGEATGDYLTRVLREEAKFVDKNLPKDAIKAKYPKKSEYFTKTDLVGYTPGSRDVSGYEWWKTPTTKRFDPKAPLEMQYKQWMSSMSHYEYGSLRAYTRDGYKELRQWMIHRRGENLNGIAKLMDNALKTAPKTKTGTLYRGLQLTPDELANWKKGNTLQFKNFISTTDKIRAANRFAGKAGGAVVLEIEGASATRIPNRLSYARSDEGEYLFRPNAKFKVIDTYKKGKRTHIKLKLVNEGGL